MSPEVAALIGLFAGSLITGAFGVWNTWYIQSQERQSQQQKAALEALLEVHDGLGELSKIYGLLLTQSLQSVTGGQLQPVTGLEASQKLSRLDYGLSLYAPEMKTGFDAIQRTSAQFMDQWMSLTIALSRGQGHADRAALMALAGQTVDQQKAISIYQKALANYAHRTYFKPRSWLHRLDENSERGKAVT